MAEYLHYIFYCRQFSFVKSENSFTSVSGRGGSLGLTVLRMPSIGLIFVFISFSTPPQPSRNFCYFLLSQKQRNCDMFPSFPSWLFMLQGYHTPGNEPDGLILRTERVGRGCQPDGRYVPAPTQFPKCSVFVRKVRESFLVLLKGKAH